MGSRILGYVKEHPQANAVDIGRELFADNGMARRAAVENILFFFGKQGLICRERGKGMVLTEAGENSLESGYVWQGMKGAFMGIYNGALRFLLKIFRRNMGSSWNSCSSVRAR